MTNPLKTVQQMLESNRDNQQFQATVVDEQRGAVRVRREGSSVLEGPYPRLLGVTVAAGDLVLVTRLGTSYLVMGKIDRAAIPLVPVPPVSLALGGDLSGTTAHATVNLKHAGSSHNLGGEVTGAIANTNVAATHSGSPHYPSLLGEVFGPPSATEITADHGTYGLTHAAENLAYGFQVGPGPLDPDIEDYTSPTLSLPAGEWMVLESSSCSHLFADQAVTVVVNGTSISHSGKTPGGVLYPWPSVYFFGVCHVSGPASIWFQVHVPQVVTYVSNPHPPPEFLTVKHPGAIGILKLVAVRAT